MFACQEEPSPSLKQSSSSTIAQQSETLTPSQASRHVGSQATVCGLVVSTNYATGSNGKPTFLNFDKPYPNHPFAVVIWGNDRPKFPPNPERYYLNKPLCATGLIESYKGKPEITAHTSTHLVDEFPLTIDD
jgi:hypothetical protein